MKESNAGKFRLSKSITMNKVDYYTCWEDFEVIQKALEINSDDVIFSITSGGCNVLNFLLHKPKKILAVDYNPYQNYLLEFKIEAIRNLDYVQFLQLMGVTYYKKRHDLYEIVRKNLSKDARAFWDINSFVVEKGVLNVGEQDVKYLGRILRFLKGKNNIEKFFSCETIEEQTDYFYKNIHGLPWRIYHSFTYKNYVVKLALCLRALREYPYRRKKSSGYFGYMQKVNYPKDHLKKIEDVYTKIPIRYNNFASLVLLGYYSNENCFPPYLRKENYDLLKQEIDKIEIKTGSVADVLRKLPDESVTKFNLSNIFDWADDDAFKNQLVEIIRVGKNQGKIFYSTTRGNRLIPKDMKCLCSYERLATELLKEDRTAMYSDFQIGKICK